MEGAPVPNNIASLARHWLLAHRTTEHIGPPPHDKTAAEPLVEQLLHALCPVDVREAITVRQGIIGRGREKMRRERPVEFWSGQDKQLTEPKRRLSTSLVLTRTASGAVAAPIFAGAARAVGTAHALGATPRLQEPEEVPAAPAEREYDLDEVTSLLSLVRASCLTHCAYRNMPG